MRYKLKKQTEKLFENFERKMAHRLATKSKGEELK
jgi:hypothetical protein